MALLSVYERYGLIGPRSYRECLAPQMGAEQARQVAQELKDKKKPPKEVKK